MIDFEDYYEILGVNPEATPGEIKKTYREKCFAIHPDRLIGAADSVKKRAENELVRVNRAYNVLTHPEKRHTYYSEWLRCRAKPKPIVNPAHIVFDDMEPGQIGRASFLIDNAGGPCTRVWISNPNSWLKIVDHHYVTASTGLLRGVHIVAQGKDWGETYRETIVVKLDEEEARVTVELKTRLFPKLDPRKEQNPKTKISSRSRLYSQTRPQPVQRRAQVALLVLSFFLLVGLLLFGINMVHGMQDKIVFQSDSGGNSEIYIMNTDGSSLKCLTNNSASDRCPSWSPDGSKIVFQSDRDGNDEIYVMNTDGSDVRRLTAHTMSDRYPVWSPDSSRIAFQSDRDGNPEIYIRDIDGSNLRRLTDNLACDSNPVWSPDGSEIAFQSDRNGNPEVYIVNVDGSNLKRLTSNLASEWHPAWSPDGRKIFFQSAQGGNPEIYVMNADGGNLKQITYTSRFVQQKIVAGDTTISNLAQDDVALIYALSPDGEKIVFQADHDGDAEIYVVDTDGSNLLRLTIDPASDEYPRWSSDGTKVVFKSDRDGDSKLYIMNADGSSLRPLNKNLNFDGYLMWAPRYFRLPWDNI